MNTLTTGLHLLDFLLSYLQSWLVSPPQISNFSWDDKETLGTSPYFLVFTVITYLSLTYLLCRLPLPTLSSKLLKSITVVHNIFLLSLSFTMALGTTISMLSSARDFESLICFPKNIKPKGPLFFWAYIFYLSKIIEFLDTLLIIISKSFKRLTFLHVYHHAVVLIMCYVAVNTSQSGFTSLVVYNCSVHVIMYLYYLLCAFGIRPSWKRLLTDLQIFQFMSGSVMMALLTYFHVTGNGCSGIWTWTLNAAFLVSLVFLFLDFRSKSYPTDKKKAN